MDREEIDVSLRNIGTMIIKEDKKCKVRWLIP